MYFIQLSTIKFKSIMSIGQHGFVADRSPAINLCCFAKFVLETLWKKPQVDAIYTDFAKVFDPVDYSILLQKLDNIDIIPNMLKLLKSYLDNRKQFVYVIYTTSKTNSCLCTSVIFLSYFQ